jgi:hypothetical protein
MRSASDRASLLDVVASSVVPESSGVVIAPPHAAATIALPNAAIAARSMR